MAALTPTTATQRVLENIGRVVGDAACPADAIQRRLDDEYRRLRRKLSAEFPTLYETVSATTTLTGSTVTITKPSDCDAVRVVEKQAGALWTSLVVLPSLNRDEGACLGFYEQGGLGGNIIIAPTASAPGTYRMYYDKVPPATITTYELPDGLEGIILEETSAWGRQRHDEDPTYHKAAAKQIWDDAYMGLWNRYGSHGQSGLQITRVW